MGLWDPYKEKVQELSNRASTSLDNLKTSGKNQVHALKDFSAETARASKGAACTRYKQAKSAACEQWRAVRPEAFNYWGSAKAWRAAYVRDTPLAYRVTTVALSTGLLVLVTPGLLRRVRRGCFVGGVLACCMIPEVVNPFNKV